jgi:hypothetical protein
MSGAQILQEISCAAQYRHPRGRRLHRAAGSDKKRGPDLFLKGTDTLRNGSRREIEPTRCFRHRPIVNDGNEAVEELRVHTIEKLSIKDTSVHIFFCEKVCTIMVFTDLLHGEEHEKR